jgi:hypothetical protein
LVGSVPDDTPVLALGGIIDCKHRGPSRGHPGLAAAGGGTGGIPSIRRTYVEVMGGADTRDVGCWWHVVWCRRHQGGRCWPRLGDGTGGLLWDLVTRGASCGVPRSAALGGVTLAAGSSGAMGPRCMDCSCQALPAFRPSLLTRGVLGMKQSQRVHGSPLRRGCCMSR